MNTFNSNFEIKVLLSYFEAGGGGGIAYEASFDSRYGQEIFLFSKISRPVLGHFQFLIPLIMEILYTGVKRLACGANGSPVFVVNFNSEWICTSTISPAFVKYEGWNFNSGNYFFTTDTK